MALLGVFGIVGEAVIRRTRELGIRLALGARVRHAITTVAMESIVPTVSGLVLGIAVLLVLADGIQKLFFPPWIDMMGLDSTDVGVLTGTGSALLLVAVLASIFGARRASKIDPAAALRAD